MNYSYIFFVALNLFSKTKKLFLFISCTLIFLEVQAQGEWAQQMGGGEGDVGNCTTADSFGAIYTIGTFSGTSVFGSHTISAVGKGDIFITRANASNGDITWVKQIGSANEDNGSAIVCDPSGNVYCTGRFSGIVVFGTFTLTSSGSSDSFLAKLDPLTGSFLWAKRMGGTGADGGLAITSDGSGNIYTSGYLQGTATFGTFTLSPVGTNYNIFLTRTDGPSGNVVWAKNYGNAGYSFGTSVSCDAAGDVYMTGYFEGDVAFGSYTVSSVQYQDIFVSRHYASTGNSVWAASAGGAGNDSGSGITVSTDGYVYTTGKFEGSSAFGTTTLTSQGSSDIFVTKRDAVTGTLVWVKQFGAAGYEQANAIANDATGHLFITGHFNGFVNFGSTMLASYGNADVFIVQLDAVTGNALWARGMGGVTVDSGYGISTGPDNALYCTGFFQSNADLVGFSFISKGNTDIFVLKLNSTTVGIKENTDLYNSIKVLPVPFKDGFDIVVNKNNFQPYNLILTDISGKKILHLDSELPYQHVNVEFLEAGIYFVIITEKNGASAVKKIVKN